VKGGCSKIYEGITAYLGEENVVLDSLVTYVKKTPGKVQLRGINTETNRAFKYNCDNLVIAFAQTADNLAIFDLDSREQDIFNQVGTRNYWWGTADLTAPSAVHSADAFSMQIRTLSDPFLTPPYPSLNLVNRGSTNQRPAAWYAASGVQKLNDSAITTIINSDAATMVSLGALSSFTITDFNFHEYQPFVKNVSALTASPNLYTRIASLQGYRHTYYVGGLVGYAGSFIVWENAYNLVQAHFPA